MNLEVREPPKTAHRSVLDTLHIATPRQLQVPQALQQLTPLVPFPAYTAAPGNLLLPYAAHCEGQFVLGTGGCGAVYLAVITGLHGRRLVALKETKLTLYQRVKNRQLTPRQALERGLREYDIMRASGSTLAPTELYYCRQTPNAYGSLFAVMPAMRGDAVDITNALRLKYPELASLWARHVMGALIPRLATMHARGYLHADIKPENVLVDFDSEPHLADYGLAAPISEAQSLRGSLDYAAPEQLVRAADPANQFDDRADVYATAISILALFGQNPLRAECSMDSQWEAYEKRQHLAEWHNDERAQAHPEKVTGRRSAIRQRVQDDMEAARQADPKLFSLLVDMLPRFKTERPRMAWVVEEFKARGLALSHAERLTLHKALLKLPVLPQARVIAAALRQ